MSSAANKTILDLDAMMDSTLDNIADIPDYMNPPTGNYRLAIGDACIEKMEAKPANGDTPARAAGSRIKITYKVVETKELSNAGDLPVPDGTLFTETFTGTEEGLEFFKKQVKKIMNEDSVDGVSLRDLLDGIKDAEFDAALTARTTVSKGKTYENVNVRPVHSVAA